MKTKKSKPAKIRPQILIVTLRLLGTLLILSGFAAFLATFFLFWEESCQACSNGVIISCTGNSAVLGVSQMDWSFLWLDIYFLAAIIVGPIFLVATSGMRSKKSYLKAYPHMTVCPECKTLADRREGNCPKCGADIDPTGEYRKLNNDNPYFDTFNPYDAFRNKNLAKPQAIIPAQSFPPAEDAEAVIEGQIENAPSETEDGQVESVIEAEDKIADETQNSDTETEAEQPDEKPRLENEDGQTDQTNAESAPEEKENDTKDNGAKENDEE